MYESQLSQIITDSITRLHQEMQQHAPLMADSIADWIKQLSGEAQPQDYFKHPKAFPSLLLPWWLEKTLRDPPDPLFQANLVYSTINGYYYIRLIDNLMDGNATIERHLLPALNLFHIQFQMAYQHYFGDDHPFWDFFQSTWFHSAQVTFKDAQLTDIDATQFEQIAAQKTCAVKIPLAAVCYRYEQPDLIAAWGRFADRFGCWHQLFNDLFDWHRDESRGIRTYFLSEAERHRRENEPIAGWVAREGFAWGIEILQRWMAELKDQVQQLGSADLSAYLNTRETMLLKQQENVAPGLQSLAKIMGSNVAQ